MAVNKVEINGDTVVDLTEDTVSPDTLLEGETAHDKSGAIITGRLMMPVASVNGGTGDVVIGGRNYLRDTESMSEFLFSTGGQRLTTADGFTYISLPPGAPTSSSSGHKLITSRPLISFLAVRGNEVTLSFLARSSEAIITSSSQGFALEFDLCTSESQTRIKYRVVNVPDVEIGTEWTRCVYTTTLNDTFFRSGAGAIDEATHLYIRIYNTSPNTLDIKKIQLEIGNVPTDWTPSPEDKQDIYKALWVNVAPMSEFTGQSIPIPELGNYETFIIYYYGSTTTTYHGSSMVRIPEKSSCTVMMSVPIVTDTSSFIMSARTVAINRVNNTIEFGAGRKLTSIDASDDNEQLIPVEVYGIPG